MIVLLTFVRFNADPFSIVPALAKTTVVPPPRWELVPRNKKLLAEAVLVTFGCITIEDCARLLRNLQLKRKLGDLPQEFSSLYSSRCSKCCLFFEVAMQVPVVALTGKLEASQCFCLKCRTGEKKRGVYEVVSLQDNHYYGKAAVALETSGANIYTQAQVIEAMSDSVRCFIILFFSVSKMAPSSLYNWCLF